MIAVFMVGAFVLGACAGCGLSLLAMRRSLLQDYAMGGAIALESAVKVAARMGPVALSRDALLDAAGRMRSRGR